MQKKRVIKQYENLSVDLQELVKAKYPFGYRKSLIKLTTPDKKVVSAFPLETEDTYYLVKVPVAAPAPTKIDPKIMGLDDDDDDDDDIDDEDDAIDDEDIDNISTPKKRSIKNAPHLEDLDGEEAIDEIPLDLDF